MSISYITKKQYYKNSDVKEITDNKKFSKSLKSHFGKGDSNSEKIMFLENNNSIKTNKKEIATITNNFLLRWLLGLRKLKSSEKVEILQIGLTLRVA